MKLYLFLYYTQKIWNTSDRVMFKGPLLANQKFFQAESVPATTKLSRHQIWRNKADKILTWQYASYCHANLRPSLTLLQTCLFRFFEIR